MKRKQYERFFEVTTRKDTDKSFVRLRDDAPEELRDFVREIHFDYFGGCLPNDWIYRTMMEAFEELEYEELDNLMIEADLYSYDLRNWSMEPYADDFIRDGQQEFGLSKAGIDEIISWGQYLAKQTIYQAVDQWIQEEEETNEEEEE